MSDNTCDNCGTEVEELFYNEASGLSYCDACDVASEAPEFPDFSVCEDEGGFHGELRAIIEQAEGLGNLGFGSDSPLAALIPHAEALLALPEESVAALVSAAQSMTEAASFGR